jgi:hypothetical protein
MSLKIENSRRVAKSRPVCMGLNTNIYKICELHFTTFSNQSCSFTHSKTLFLALVFDFVLLALIKI